MGYFRAARGAWVRAAENQLTRKSTSSKPFAMRRPRYRCKPRDRSQSEMLSWLTTGTSITSRSTPDLKSPVTDEDPIAASDKDKQIQQKHTVDFLEKNKTPTFFREIIRRFESSRWALVSQNLLHLIQLQKCLWLTLNFPFYSTLAVGSRKLMWFYCVKKAHRQNT